MNLSHKRKRSCEQDVCDDFENECVKTVAESSQGESKIRRTEDLYENPGHEDEDEEEERNAVVQHTDALSKVAKEEKDEKNVLLCTPVTRKVEEEPQTNRNVGQIDNNCADVEDIEGQDDGGNCEQFIDNDFDSNSDSVVEEENDVEAYIEENAEEDEEEEEEEEDETCVDVAKRKKQNSAAHGYIVYLLQSEIKPRTTYCGITNRRSRRIRQHNGEISGGAKRTRGRGPWRMYAVVTGFIDKRDALRFEWSVHNPRKRRLRAPHYGRQGRLNVCKQLLMQDPWINYCQRLRLYVHREDLCLSCVEILENECSLEFTAGRHPRVVSRPSS